MLFPEHLVHQAVLDIDAPGVGATQVAHQFFARRWVLELPAKGGLAMPPDQKAFQMLSICDLRVPVIALAVFLSAVTGAYGQ